MSIDTIHGKVIIDDPLALELIHHKNFQRMKNIQQHGLNHKALHEPSFTRYEHSIGVYALLKKHGASRKEQIAGLLHDVSHTAFSHVGDTFFGHKDGIASWQDLDHDNFLEQSGLASVVRSHDMDLQDIMPKRKDYKRLEQDLPDLCADRINYILHGGMILEFFSKERVAEIDKALVFNEDKQRWYFNDLQAAHDFSQASLWQTDNCWGHSANFNATRWFVEAVREGIAKNLITQDDFRWGTDDKLWNKLEKNSNKKIVMLLKKIKEAKKHTVIKKVKNCTAPLLHYTFKLRGVDPLVLHKGKLARLSEHHPSYKKDFALFKEKLSKGKCLALS